MRRRVAQPIEQNRGLTKPSGVVASNPLDIATRKPPNIIVAGYCTHGGRDYCRRTGLDLDQG